MVLALSSVKQEFTAELGSIIESDEAYGSNVRILTYSPKEDVINGKFKDSWNNRVYEFIIDVDGISYKPAIKLDSFSADEMPARFDSYSGGYNSLFVDNRIDRGSSSKRVKKPKCGNAGYGCGYSCIGLLKTCRILSSGNKGGGTNQGKAIGQQRLNKLIALSEKLYLAGDKKGASSAGAIAADIQKTRTKYTGGGQALINERAWTKLEQEKAESLAKEQEKKSAKSISTSPTSKNIYNALGTAASEYGWRVTDNSLYNRAGKKVHDIKIKGNRIHILDEGKLRGTIPLSKPENIGTYLEKTFYAKKNDIRPIVGKFTNKITT